MSVGAVAERVDDAGRRLVVDAAALAGGTSAKFQPNLRAKNSARCGSFSASYCGSAYSELKKQNHGHVVVTAIACCSKIYGV